MPEALWKWSGRPFRALAVTGLLIALALEFSGCGATKSPDDSFSEAGNGVAKQGAATRTNESGEVTIKVVWEGRDAGPTFDVTMDTHSVDLDGYDLRKLAVLRNDGGQEVRARAWAAPKGGHHREGKLSFPEKASDGGAVIGRDTREITLIIRDVAGVPERSFEWNL
ncbi:hypothetical protein GBA63_18675 [Rubrobacter tropicus]|uniref:Uncharacterized protein n=1 Tax=Rubrobacter tropicus TaxID=2653851 RepID=A0A6G8QDD0_9ACTN|nr:hypothetical protein [Rubrobacter tropicus]QIN84442.1 hypothetical protein GBA63_18675 [Rubrobacter tropicus]